MLNPCEDDRKTCCMLMGRLLKALRQPPAHKALISMSLVSALRECLLDLSDTFLDPSKHDISDGFCISIRAETTSHTRLVRIAAQILKQKEMDCVRKAEILRGLPEAPFPPVQKVPKRLTSLGSPP